MMTGASAATVYLDGTLPQPCESYDVEQRACGTGVHTAFSTTAGALGSLAPGDTLVLRAGRFGALEFHASGTPEAPITVQPYSGEDVVIQSPRDVALMIRGLSDIIIEDLAVRDVLGFGRLEDSTRITLKNITFSSAQASGTTGALKLVRSTHNRIDGASFDDGSDLVLFQDDSNQNVLINTTFARASHSQLSIRCSSSNVVRRNTFNNPKQKSVEIYDCEGVSDAPVRLDATHRNLLEYNQFYGTAPASRDYYFNAIQHGGQHAIVRRNVFADNLGGGVNYQYYSQESLFVYGNRLYHNTFFHNACYAVIGQSGSRSRFHDNLVTNNLFYQNYDCGGRPGHVSVRDRRAVKVARAGQLDDREDPLFTNVSAKDFRLNSGSSLIDAGSFLTRTTTSGHGRTLPVEDASWFFDGFSIRDELGDVIRIEGAGATARVVSIDYDDHLLSLDTDLSWSKKDGVTIEFFGKAPDIGAFELERPSR